MGKNPISERAEKPKPKENLCSSVSVISVLCDERGIILTGKKAATPELESKELESSLESPIQFL